MATLLRLSSVGLTHMHNVAKRRPMYLYGLPGKCLDK